MSNGVQYVTISSNESGQRIDNFLIKILKGAPKSLIYRIIRKGEVRVNKGRVKPERKLAEGDIVRIPPVRTADRKEANPSESLQNHIASSILYESDALLIVNKPSGLAVHGGSGISLGLIESLRAMNTESQYLELVHRLDRDTSGCVMVAKKRSMLVHLQSLLTNKTSIDKRYLALVKGHWPKRKRVVDAPLRKNELKSGERVVKVQIDGKDSRTEFDIVKTFENATLMDVKPVTGRTHQIRVHALHVGCPLVGDDKYGEDDFNKSMKPFGFKRLFLHASSLDLLLPDGERLKVEAPLPDELHEALKKLGQA